MSSLDGWRRIAMLSQLHEGEAFPARLGDTPIALYRLNGRVYAIDDVCTHEFALLSQGFVEDCTIECPLHQAKFDITTGKCLSAPATVDLMSYAVRIEGDEVYVNPAPPHPHSAAPHSFGDKTLDTRLKDKVAIVTGGARGIGASFCEALAAAGAKIAVADVLDGEAVVERIAKTQARAIYRRTDVTSKDSVEAMVADTVREFGTVDILVNNAGLFADLAKKPFQEISSEEWDRVMAVNVRGSFECAKAIAPVMIAANKGRIVNIASGTVFKGFVSMLHYVTSKGAVVAMTRCLARELGPHNICVNAIAPGLTMSEAVAVNAEWSGKANAGTVASRALQRDEVPADLTGTLVYLCSDDSNFVTGQTIVVDGGSVMR